MVYICTRQSRVLSAELCWERRHGWSPWLNVWYNTMQQRGFQVTGSTSYLRTAKMVSVGDIANTFYSTSNRKMYLWFLLRQCFVISSLQDLQLSGLSTVALKNKLFDESKDRGVYRFAFFRDLTFGYISYQKYTLNIVYRRRKTSCSFTDREVKQRCHSATANEKLWKRIYTSINIFHFFDWIRCLFSQCLNI